MKYDYEYNVVIPSCGTTIYMQEGSGCQLDAFDYAAGYEGYIDYDILAGPNVGDGGIYMFKDDVPWIEKIPETIMYILNVEKCPDYYLQEVA